MTKEVISSKGKLFHLELHFVLCMAPVSRHSKLAVGGGGGQCIFKRILEVFNFES
jgi:hypothetical protein